MLNMPDLMGRRAELVKLMHRLKMLDASADQRVTAEQTIASLRCLIDELDDYVLNAAISFDR